MLSKCANPHCPTLFHYFREGKVVRVLRPRGLSFAPLSLREIAQEPGQPGHNVEHFWLCGSCSPQYQIAINREGVIAVVPRQSPFVGGGRKAPQLLEQQLGSLRHEKPAVA
jgi:hypothetical protein